MEGELMYWPLRCRLSAFMLDSLELKLGLIFCALYLQLQKIALQLRLIMRH